MSDKLSIVRNGLSRRSSDSEYSVLDYGKIPPQSKPLEEAVLGAIMLEAAVFGQIVRILKGDSYFYVDAHQRIYGAMIALWADNSPIDLLTVTEQLKSTGDLDAAGGPYYVAQLTNKVGSAANAEYHAMVLKECWVKRQAICFCTEVIKDAYEDTSDAFEVLEKAVTGLNDTLIDASSSGEESFASIVDDFDDKLKKAAKNEGADKYVIGYRTGNYALDRVTLGMNAPDLVLIAGRPSEGKTTMMLQGVRENARAGIPCAVFSLEMSNLQVLQKLYAMEAGIDLEKLRTGTLNHDEWNRYEMAKKLVRTWPIHICDRGGLSIAEMKAIATGWHVRYGKPKPNCPGETDFVMYVDYLQLVTVSVDEARVSSREQEIGYISRSLKALAKSLHIPVIALSQMSRLMENRPVKERRPIMSDLRESGSLEQDADVVIFVYRPEKHGIKAFDDGESTEDATEFIVAKNRMGPIKNVRAHFEGLYSRFVDWTNNFTRSYTPRNTSEDTRESSSSAADEDTPF